MTDRSGRAPVLITDAAMSYEQELAIRKRRYAIMMGLRIPCMIAAVGLASIPWLAITLLLVSIPLPWMAVLIANDRLPRTVERPHRYRSARPELETRHHQVIDTADPVNYSETPRDPSAPSRPAGA